MSTTTPEYLKLINEFPLRFIRDRETNEIALKVMVELAQRENELTDSEMEYFELLADLVQTYEKGVVPAVEPMAPNDFLNHLMTEHNLRQVDICAQTGIPKTNLSAFLNGARKLTRDEIGKLAIRFSVNPLAFVEDDHFGESYMQYSKLLRKQGLFNKARILSKGLIISEGIVTNEQAQQLSESVGIITVTPANK